MAKCQTDCLPPPPSLHFPPFNEPPPKGEKAAKSNSHPLYLPTLPSPAKSTHKTGICFKITHQSMAGKLSNSKSITKAKQRSQNAKKE